LEQLRDVDLGVGLGRDFPQDFGESNPDHPGVGGLEGQELLRNWALVDVGLDQVGVCGKPNTHSRVKKDKMAVKIKHYCNSKSSLSEE